MKQKIYYTTYETTNILNNKYYIGMHQTRDLNDGYMGSGTHLKKSIAKYKIENFTTIITGVWRSRKIMILMEAWLIDDKVINDPNSYNIAPGGLGGWKHAHNKTTNLKVQQTKRNTVLENGLSIFQNAARKISKTMNTTQTNGKTLSQNSAIKAEITKNKIGNDGITIRERSSIKRANTRRYKLSQDENIYDSVYNNHSKMMRTIQKNGLSLAQNSAAKAWNTKRDRGITLKGSSNPAAIKVNIFNNLGELMFSTYGNFQQVCFENQLPFSALKNSYLSNKKVYEKMSPQSEAKLKNNGNIKFRGWYAIRVD